jgi:hypothetical protein
MRYAEKDNHDTHGSLGAAHEQNGLHHQRIDLVYLPVCKNVRYDDEDRHAVTSPCTVRAPKPRQLKADYYQVHMTMNRRCLAWSVVAKRLIAQVLVSN